MFFSTLPLADEACGDIQVSRENGLTCFFPKPKGTYFFWG